MTKENKHKPNPKWKKAKYRIWFWFQSQKPIHIGPSSKDLTK